jgi:hypothetical protein
MARWPGSWLWPTPTANNYESEPEVFLERREREKAKGRNGNGFGLTLGMAARLWPTPEASDGSGGRLSSELGGQRPSGSKRAVTLATAVSYSEQQIWPTPTARLGDQRGPQAKRYFDPARSNDLDDAVAAGTTGQLNPTWVEWLMGFPTGWTDLEPSATP